MGKYTELLLTYLGQTIQQNNNYTEICLPSPRQSEKGECVLLVTAGEVKMNSLVTSYYGYPSTDIAALDHLQKAIYSELSEDAGYLTEHLPTLMSNREVWWSRDSAQTARPDRKCH